MNPIRQISIAALFLAAGLAWTGILGLSFVNHLQQFDRTIERYASQQNEVKLLQVNPELTSRLEITRSGLEVGRQEMLTLRDRIRLSLLLNGVSAFGILLFLTYVTLRTVRIIERSLRLVSEDKYSTGNEEMTPFTEVRRILSIANVLSLKVEELGRLKRTLDEMPVNIMIADRHRNWTISYLNRTSEETLKAIESSLAVPIDQVLGSNIDIFHKNPNHQRQMLSNERNLPHRAKIKLGKDTLDLRVSAIHDAQGHYVSALLTWSLATANVKLADDFESDVATVVETVTSAADKMKDSANVLSSAALETGTQAISVAKSSDIVNKNVSTVASATDELTSSIGEISQRIHEASHSIRQIVNQTNVASQIMIELSKAADDIKGVAAIIDSITSQINLLALNATIESARAGEAGKGFAIVASEIKSLANETTRATAEISKRIETVVKQTQNASVALAGIDTDIGRVDSVALTIAGAVEQQRAATAEIARNVSDVTGQVKTVSENVEGMAQVAEDTGRLATSVLEQASNLGDEGDRLKKAVESFLMKVRAI